MAPFRQCCFPHQGIPAPLPASLLSMIDHMSSVDVRYDEACVQNISEIAKSELSVCCTAFDAACGVSKRRLCKNTHQQQLYCVTFVRPRCLIIQICPFQQANFCSPRPISLKEAIYIPPRNSTSKRFLLLRRHSIMCYSREASFAFCGHTQSIPGFCHNPPVPLVQTNGIRTPRICRDWYLFPKTNPICHDYWCHNCMNIIRADIRIHDMVMAVESGGNTSHTRPERQLGSHRDWSGGVKKEE